MKFYKYQGLGNDFVFTEDFAGDLLAIAPRLAREICDRNFGIGSDGFVLITKPDKDYTMRIFNADGTEAEMCGNAIRCLAKHLLDYGYVQGDHLTIGTLKASRDVSVRNNLYTVDMGEPILDVRDIPMNVQGTSFGHTIQVLDRKWEIHGVSMGNPHGVVFVSTVDSVVLNQIGPILETNPIFPAKANIEFVQLVNRQHINVKVWERGVGPTLACGTGACASAVVAAHLGLTDKHVQVSLPGGDLYIEWKSDNHVWMTGPATLVFRGEYTIYS